MDLKPSPSLIHYQIHDEGLLCVFQQRIHHTTSLDIITKSLEVNRDGYIDFADEKSAKSLSRGGLAR